MRMTWLIRDYLGWTLIFFALVAVAVVTQLMKTKRQAAKKPPLIPVYLRAFIKAAPALFLSGLSLYLGQPLIAVAFLLCAIGDILLDIPENQAPLAFEIGAASFALALICFSVASYRNQLEGYPFLPLAITNVAIAVFILRWVFPLIPKGVQRIMEGSYFGILIIANVIASMSTLPVFLGSSLWFMSDLSIGLETRVPESPANSLDTLGLYDLGLYFLAVGFLNF